VAGFGSKGFLSEHETKATATTPYTRGRFVDDHLSNSNGYQFTSQKNGLV